MHAYVTAERRGRDSLRRFLLDLDAKEANEVEARTIGEVIDLYFELTRWLRTLGEDVVVGIEGAGSYGAGLCEFLLAEGIHVVEVERPRRQDRRRGKSDEIDALMAAKKVLAKDGLSTPRAGGTRQALAALLVAQRSCVSERTRLLNQLQALHTTAPVALRERIGPGNGRKLAARPVRDHAGV
jgi:transposase